MQKNHLKGINQSLRCKIQFFLQLSNLWLLFLYATAIISFCFVSLNGCSVNLDDPEEDANLQIEKNFAFKDSDLIGFWHFDSTFTPTDRNAIQLNKSPASELLLGPDSIFHFFNGHELTGFDTLIGKYTFINDTIYLLSKVPIDTIISGIPSLTFLGNYIKLFLPSSSRYIFGHKSNSFSLDSMIQGQSLWQAKKYRNPNYAFKDLKPIHEQAYFILDSNKAIFERLNLFEPYLKNQYDAAFQLNKLTLMDSSNSIERNYTLLAKTEDSFIFWKNNPPTSSDTCWFYEKRETKSQFYLPMDSIIGYWRADSLEHDRNKFLMNMEEFFDFEFQGSKFTLFKELDALPPFDTLKMDSGRIRLLENKMSNSINQFKQTLWFPQIKSNQLILSVSPYSYGNSLFNSENLKIYFTKIQKLDFSNQPKHRFPAHTYMQLIIKDDTLNFANQAINKQSFSSTNYQVLEAQSKSSNSFKWSILKLPLTTQAITSSDENFFIALEYKDDTLYSLANTPGNLTVRMAYIDSTKVWEGQLEGRLAKGTVDPVNSIQFSDSIEVIGSFRIGTKKGNLQSPLWSSYQLMKAKTP